MGGMVCRHRWVGFLHQAPESKRKTQRQGGGDHKNALLAAWHITRKYPFTLLSKKSAFLVHNLIPSVTCPLRMQATSRVLKSFIFPVGSFAWGEVDWFHQYKGQVRPHLLHLDVYLYLLGELNEDPSLTNTLSLNSDVDQFFGENATWRRVLTLPSLCSCRYWDLNSWHVSM